MSASPSLVSSTDWSTNPVVAAAVWRAHQLGRVGAARGVPSQFVALDAELPEAGWPRGALTELLAESFGVGELRLLMPALAQLTRAGRPVLWISPPAMPYAPALVHAGVALEHLLLVQPANDRDRWWAIEQSLKSGCTGAVLAWLPEERRLATNDRLRRLQLAAAGSDGLCFVFRPAAARTVPSAAPLRIVLAAAEGGRLSLTLLKRRGPPRSAPITIDSAGGPALTSRAAPDTVSRAAGTGAPTAIARPFADTAAANDAA
jgi:protein ImuA